MNTGSFSSIVRLTTLVSCFLAISTVEGQTFFLKETFAGTADSTAPTGWQARRISGGTTAGFRFDNRANVQTSYPLQAPFAAFDAPSSMYEGSSHVVALESPELDLTGRDKLLLSYDHQYVAGSEASGKVQVLANNVWTDVETYTQSGQGSPSVVIDLSNQLANIKNARVRFLWTGKSTGSWVIDNVKLFAPITLDVGVVSIDAPVSPFGEGPSPIEVSLFNYGATTVSRSKISWSVNGNIQPDITWTGTLDFGKKRSGIRLGTVDMRAGASYLLKVWSDDPNALLDGNPSNDTTIRVLIPSLCGNYTIGGSTPNFPTISRAAEYLHNAGVGCPVVFKIRDGQYVEQPEFRAIRGSSFVNTVTFESESGDSARVRITTPSNISSYTYTLSVNGARHLRFRKLAISKQGGGSGYFAMEIGGDSYDIRVQNCQIDPLSSSGIQIRERADSIRIEQNLIRGTGDIYSGDALRIQSSGKTDILQNILTSFYSTGINMWGAFGRINIQNNQIQNSNRGISSFSATKSSIINNRIARVNSGIDLEGNGEYIIQQNRIAFINQTGISGRMKNSLIANNWIHNDLNNEKNSIAGIRLNNSTNVNLAYNSVHLRKSNSNGAGLLISGGDSMTLTNNILSIKEEALPIKINSDTVAIFSNYNDFFSTYGTIGSYNGETIKDFDTWKSVTKNDINSLTVHPYFTKDSVLIPNNNLLNNTAKPIPSIPDDIDFVIRDKNFPDYGAKEFDPCQTDAGIVTIVSPKNPLSTGVQPIKVKLSNQGRETLTSTTIGWMANNGTQGSYNWTGSLAPGSTTDVNVGTIDIKPATAYSISSWTKNPNAKVDCNPINDTTSTPLMYSKLCGVYTIGGSNPNFRTIGEATDFLNKAGISCAVTLRIRNGTYNEQVTIDSVGGASPSNLITIESESGDSSKVTMSTAGYVSGFRHTLKLNGTKHIRIKNISIAKYGSRDFYYGLEISGNAYDVKINNCQFNMLDAIGIYLSDQADSIYINNNFLSGNTLGTSNQQGYGIFDQSAGKIILQNNIITSFYYSGIYLSKKFARIGGNKIEKCRYGIDVYTSVEAQIINNVIQSNETGLRLSGTGQIVSNNKIEFKNRYGIDANVRKSIISNNWVSNRYNTDQNTTSAVRMFSCDSVKLLNNAMHLQVSESNTNGLIIERGRKLWIENNIVSMKQTGLPVSILNVASELIANRNVYYSPYPVIGSYNGKVINDLASWRSAALIDSNSLAVNPFFRNDSTLVPNHYLLNGTASVQPEVPKDMDGITRDPMLPDIGAKEFSICSDDAGISAVLKPINPLGSGRQAITVRLFNHGKNPLTSTTIGWKLNNEAASYLNWKGTLASGNHLDIMVDSVVFSPSTSYLIKSWTTSPNLKTDCNVYNDTSISVPLYSKLCGTYTIGGNAPNFKTIREAVDFLNQAGVSCAVRFLIRNGTYEDQIVIDSINGASPLNTITFESESGDSSKVQITSSANVSQDLFTINLFGTKHLRIKNVSIGKKGDANNAHVGLEIGKDAFDIQITNCLFNPQYATAINLRDSSNAILLRNNYITGSDTRSQWTLDGIMSSSKGTIHIQDNFITSFDDYGIRSNAGKLFIQGNKITSIVRGMDIRGTDTVLISKNEINQVREGISIYNNARFQVDANRIRYTTGTGILVSSTSFARIANNWISNLENISTNGIALRTASNTSLLFNAINVTGTNNNSSAIDIQGGANNRIFNNIIKNASGGYCLKITNNSSNLLADYNCYYAPLSNIGVLNDQLYNNLEKWGVALKGEAGGIFINPFFRNNDDFKPNHILINDAGIRYDPVTHDIDSTLRHPVNPDIGAKEFVPCDLDAGINELTSPSTAPTTGKQDVRVVLQNQGLLTLDRVRIHWSINGAMQPVLEWTGTLTSRKNVEIKVGSFEFVSGPEWIIKAWTSMPNAGPDCNAFNDTAMLRLAGTANAIPPPPTGRDTLICQGKSVTLKAKGIGRLGWYTAETGGTWLSRDSVFTTPILQTSTTYYVQDSMTSASLARTPITVTVSVPPAFNPFPDRIYSKANDLTLAIDTSLRPKTVNWNTGNTTISQTVKYTGSYNVMVITDAGCRLTDTVFVQFPDTAILKVGLVNGSCTEPVEVPVSVQNFRRISRFMGEMTWDTARLRFDSLRIFQEPGMKPSDFTTTQTAAGRLRFQWATNDTSWKSLPDTTVIFAVRLIPTTSEFSTWPVNLNTDPTLFRFQDDRPVTLKSIAMNGGVAVNTCLMKLEGRVLTPLDEGVFNVQMSLAGPDAKQTLTSQDGTYALSANKGTYTLSPFKNNEREKLNGISTFDIALIQSHLLFRQRLANPYKVIAADANNSGSITTADVLFLRRMLLRIDTSLPGNRTWAFVDADQTFPNPDMPFPFRSTRSFNDLFGKVTHSFRAVKLGDVNYDRNPKLDQTWGRDTLKLIVEMKELPGLRYRVLIKFDAIDQLMGFQGTLSWDSAHLSLLTIHENPLEIGLGEGSLQQGKLLFSWNDPKALGMNFSKGSLLLDMTFQAKRGNTLPILSLTDDIIAREAFNQSFQKINMQLSMPARLEESISDASFRLHPNPTKTHINATWRSAQNETATLRLLDATGRTVWTKVFEQTPGINKQLIAIPKEISGGMYLLRLETNTNRVSRSLVIER